MLDGADELVGIVAADPAGTAVGVNDGGKIDGAPLDGTTSADATLDGGSSVVLTTGGRATSRSVADTSARRVDAAAGVDVAPADAAAVLIGPVYYRATIERSTCGPAVIDSVVDALGTWKDA